MSALIKSCFKIFIFATAMALLFNLLMPQGIGYLPEEVRHPLWQPADAAQAMQQVKAGALIIDARPASDYNASRIRGAVKMPTEDLEDMYALLADSIRLAPAAVVYGRSFSRFPAATVGQFLCQQGLSKVYVTEASLEELGKAGFAIQEPRRRAE